VIVIDPLLLSQLRALDPISRTAMALDALKLVDPDWHKAVVAYSNFEQCNVSHAARGIIWLQECLDGQRPV
jgi:hypothetical protein